MKIHNPEYKSYVRKIFEKAAFISDLGLRLQDLGPGWCETALVLLPKHLQQDAYVHAGVLATMADHTAGAASGTLIRAGEIILTAEFKINFLRPATGEHLHCKAHVLKPGNTLIVAESEVFACRQAQSVFVAKAMVTLVAVAQVDGA